MHLVLPRLNPEWRPATAEDISEDGLEGGIADLFDGGTIREEQIDPTNADGLILEEVELGETFAPEVEKGQGNDARVAENVTLEPNHQTVHDEPENCKCEN